MNKSFSSVHTLIMDRFFKKLIYKHNFIYIINACVPVPERMFSSVVILSVMFWATIPFHDE